MFQGIINTLGTVVLWYDYSSYLLHLILFISGIGYVHKLHISFDDMQTNPQKVFFCSFASKNKCPKINLGNALAEVNQTNDIELFVY